MRFLLIAALLSMSARALSCSCFDISSIEETMATHPNLVEAQVSSVSASEATLRVTRVLKGKVKARDIQIGQSMCYASLYPQIMKQNHTYVLPLSEPNPERPLPEQDGSGLSNTAMAFANPGGYDMPGCAESGFELVGDTLYTFEPTSGADRRLQRYGEYSHFLRWRPVTEARAMLGFFFLTSLEIVAERLGPLLTLSVLAICIFAPAVMFVRLGAERRRKMLALVAALPAIWLLIGLSGSVLRSPDLTSDPPVQEPSWQTAAPLVGLVVFFAFAVIFIRRVPVGRAFAVSYSLVNAYFAAMMCLFSVMVINGEVPTPWL